MRKAYPKEVRFLLADGVREETGGKVTVLGLYSGDDVVLQGDLPPILPEGMLGLALPNLSFLVVIKDGAGEFQVQYSLVDPMGGSIGRPNLEQTISKQKGIPTNIIVQVSPFPLSSFGRYKFLLEIDGRKFEYPFLVRHQDPSKKFPVSPVAQESEIELEKPSASTALRRARKKLSQPKKSTRK